jgi:hypothetical protein
MLVSPLFDLLWFVALIVSVKLPFFLQPPSATLALAFWRRAVSLVGNLGMRLKRLATGFALLGHDALHSKIEMERA